ncbi:MAG TPA: ubiquinol-cytochrome c reductase iron-sulfur subunit [Rhizomicrobium sp.]|nr:ubiquinol-cytochrome c reductase iron-sulfur subunit [Rhizomicrobium sp.]
MSESDPPIKRRDFLLLATTAAGGTGALLAAWPFIDQMEPSSDVLAAGGPVTVDVSKLLPGQQIVITWRSHPVFIVHRTPPILRELKARSLLTRLRDPDSDEPQQPAYAKNWSRSIRPEYLVVIGICTHLGCIPSLVANPGTLGPNWPGGYLCHCHGSRYDLAGRVFKSVPAPLNLPVPPYCFAPDSTLMVGENPKGENFQLSQIETL